MQGLAHVDGTMLDLADARVPLNERAYLVGDGVFETLRVAGGRPFALEQHLDRLRSGLRVIGLEADLADDAAHVIDELTAEAKSRFGDELYLRVQVTTGVMDGIAGGDGAAVTAIAKPFQPYPMRYYAQGVSVITSGQRKFIGDPLATIKHLSFLPYITARREALRATAHDALLRNDAGRYAEASTSNLFALHDGIVHAPGPGEAALPGVTRAHVLELLEDTGLDVVEPLDADTLAAAEEVWITNTTGGVVPVTRFDERPVGDGQKGELTTRLGRAVSDLVQGVA